MLCVATKAAILNEDPFPGLPSAQILVSVQSPMLGVAMAAPLGIHHLDDQPLE